MRTKQLLIACLFCWIWMAISTMGAEFKLSNGDVINGSVASATEDGLVVRLRIGGFSDRVPWAKFTQETLKLLAEDPKIKPMVEPFIEIPPEVKAKKAAEKRAIHLKPVPRVELPTTETGFTSKMASPVFLLIIGVLFAANVYAGYAAAVYRNRPPALACGVSVLLPVLGPILFLSLPTQSAVESEAESMAYAGEEYAPAPPGAAVSSSLGVAKTDKPQATKYQPATYSRDNTEFNRRFFETKFAGFFRLVLGDAEKEMVVVVKTPKQEYVAKRFARITSNEMRLQLLRDNEVSVNFSEIIQVQLRPK
jgi:hypothetical protein